MGKILSEVSIVKLEYAFEELSTEVQKLKKEVEVLNSRIEQLETEKANERAKAL